VDTSGSLEELAEEISDAARELGLLVLPAVLDSVGAAATARFEMGDWNAFLEIATALKVGVIYVGTSTLGSLISRSPDSGIYDLLEEFDEDESAQLTVGYAMGSVMHLWQQPANWLAAAEEDERAAERRSDALLEELRERASAGKWDAELLAIPAFCMVDRPAQFEIAYDFLREKGVMAEDDELALDSLVSWLIYTTRQSVHQMRDILMDRALADVPTMANELAESDPQWTKLRVAMKERAASRLVADRLGYPVPLVIEEVARWKPPRTE